MEGSIDLGHPASSSAPVVSPSGPNDLGGEVTSLTWVAEIQQPGSKLKRSYGASSLFTELEYLGLKSESKTRVVFDTITNLPVLGLAIAINESVTKLSKPVQDHADMTTYEERFGTELKTLLKQHGKEVWGKDKKRTWLLKASDGIEKYPKDLVFEDDADQKVLEKHVRQWIVLKIRSHEGVANKKSNRLAKQVDQSPITTDESGTRQNWPLVVSARPYEIHMHSTRKSPSIQVPADPLQKATLPTASGVTTTGLSKRRSQIGKYWDAESWRVFAKVSPFPLTIAIACLGLKFRSRTRGESFVDHDTGNALFKEINAIAKRLQEQLSVEDLIRCAANADYLDQDIDVLLDKYAPEIWGLDADRTRLFEPGAVEAYAKDLVYEDDDDRKLLWLYLHRWIFVKAFALLTNKRQQKERKEKKSMPEDDEDDEDGIAYNKLTLNTLNGSRLTAAFFTYLKSHSAQDTSEASSLDDIEQEFARLSKSMSSLLGNEPYALTFSVVFAAWTNYQRKILNVKSQAGTLLAEGLSEVMIKIRRARLLTELRKARDEFVATGDAESSAEDIVCLGVGRLQETVVEGEKVMQSMRQGFRTLDERLFELGESLGGGKWVVMG